MPTSAPTSRPMPTASSPRVISQPNQPCAWLSMRNWRKLRYHSNVIEGLAGAVGDADRALPEAEQARAAVDPAGTGQLVPAGLDPLEADEDPDRQPEQARPGVAEQVARERGTLDIDGLRLGRMTVLEHEDDDRDGQDPEGDRGDEPLSGSVGGEEPGVLHVEEDSGGDDRQRDHELPVSSQHALFPSSPEGVSLIVGTHSVFRHIRMRSRCRPAPVWAEGRTALRVVPSCPDEWHNFSWAVYASTVPLPAPCATQGRRARGVGRFGPSVSFASRAGSGVAFADATSLGGRAHPGLPGGPANRRGRGGGPSAPGGDRRRRRLDR